jgi:hypothetical protein
MKRITTISLVAGILAATLVVAGCSSWFESPAKPANDAISVANAKLKGAAALESEVASSAAALQGLPYTKTGAKDAVKIAAAATTALKKERTELLAAKSAMDGIAKLEVEATFKQYAKLESAAIDARIALVDAESRLYDAMGRLYSALAKASSTADMQDTITAIQRMQQEVTALADTAAQAADAASKFFTSNRLGG